MQFLDFQYIGILLQNFHIITGLDRMTVYDHHLPVIFPDSDTADFTGRNSLGCLQHLPHMRPCACPLDTFMQIMPDHWSDSHKEKQGCQHESQNLHPQRNIAKGCNGPAYSAHCKTHDNITACKDFNDKQQKSRHHPDMPDFHNKKVYAELQIC